MSRSIGRNTLLKTIAKRSYSAQAAPKLSSNDVEVHVSSKQIKLVSVYEDSPITKVSFSFKAGSRYESPDTAGITHILRTAVGLSTLENYPFNITRNLQQYGINFYAYTDRETFTVTVETHPSQIEPAFYYLNTVSTKPAFKPWEVSDNRSRVKLELLVTPPEAKVLDLLHTVAYRDGLGNSLFVDESRINQISNEHLMHFFNEHFSAPRLQITSAGLSIANLNQLVIQVDTEEGKGPQAAKAKYYGGENRVFTANESNAYVAVAAETPGYTKKEYVPYAVLKHVYGNPPPTKYGAGHGLLNKALTSTGVLGVVSGFNVGYSDSGLVGFFLAASARNAAQALDGVASAFYKADITDKDVARAKAQLKLSLRTSSEGISVVDTLSRQIGQDNLITPQQAIAAVDSVTTADVKQAAKKVAESKLSVVSYGNIASVPYFDTYKK